MSGRPVQRARRRRWIPPLAAAWLLGAALSIGALPPPGGRVERERLPLLRLAAHAPAPARQRIRIATYNIENFSDGREDGPARTEERARRQARGAARLIDALDPDILVIQEIENARALEWLNDALKAPYPFGAITRFEQDHGGPIRLNIALLSRIEPRDLVALDFGALEGPARPPRGVLRFTAPLGPRESLLAYGVHLKSNWGDRDLNEVKRYHAVRLLLEDAEDVRARRPTVAWETLVLGDMNFDPSTPRHAREPVNRLFEGWVDLWERAGGEPRVTVPTRAGGRYGDFPAVAFDRIYAAPELMRAPWIAGIPRALPAGVNTEDADAAPADGSGHVSDHYPVSVDLFRSL
jgi:endonuclease/exonuclease/phosphatase family metal-dependent hydrolase